MLKPLPIWTLNEKHPAFFDSESLTAIEQTARVYGKMQELVDSYNSFAADVNETIHDWNNNIISNYNDFRAKIEKITENYIKCVDLKLHEHDKEIRKAIDYMKNNLDRTVTEEVSRSIASGTLTVDLSYLPDSENLNLVIKEGGA